MITAPATTAHDRAGLLARLYEEQLAHGATPYLRSHAEPACVLHHVNVFEWYATSIQRGASVLDWGCNHGPDSCLLRERFGEEIDLHACDFEPASAYPVFREFARSRYTQLTDPLRLPYADNSFDAVIGSGVLEHTAMDGQALAEVWRVLKPGALLVVSYLPYAYSWDEWRLRNIARANGHRRLYTRRGFARLLLTHGFEPLDVRPQGFVPNRLTRPSSLLRGVLNPLLRPLRSVLRNPVLRSIRYPFFRQSVLCGLARKVLVM